MGGLSSKKNHKIINILYLEDVELHYDLLNYILHTHLNYKVNITWVKNSKDAYNYLNNNKIHILMIDRMLNNELGEDFTEKVLKEKLLDLTQIIYVSALEIDDICKKHIVNGALYIKKPINVKEMKKIMECLNI